VLSLLPVDAGHVLFTARRGDRPETAVPIAVGGFGRAESIEFLRNRDGDLSVSQADQLAAANADLPGELAWMVEFLASTGLSADTYLAGTGRKAREAMPMPDPPGPVD